MTTRKLVGTWGWHAVLTEPAPPTFGWLASNLKPWAGPRVRLAMQGISASGAAEQRAMWVISARVPSLESNAANSSVPWGALPAVTRQRLQYGTSLDHGVPDRLKEDLWQMNHLAGGPILDALRAAGKLPEARAFGACKDASATRKERCFEAALVEHNVSLVPFDGFIRHFSLEAIDLLVLDVWDGSVGALLRAFPFERLKPSLLYYRNPYTQREARDLRRYLMARGYSTSAHWETGAWGENNLAWRSDRCHAPHMPGRPLWARSRATAASAA